MFIGLSRSARSAQAGTVSRTHNAARPARPAEEKTEGFMRGTFFALWLISL